MIVKEKVKETYARMKSSEGKKILIDGKRVHSEWVGPESEVGDHTFEEVEE